MCVCSLSSNADVDVDNQASIRLIPNSYRNEIIGNRNVKQNITVQGFIGGYKFITILLKQICSVFCSGLCFVSVT